MLQGTDGIGLMREVRGRLGLPILFISGSDQDEIVGRALESGAPDYLDKPFSPTELVDWVRAVLRHHEGSCVRAGRARHRLRPALTFGGSTVELTASEYELVRVLSRDAERVVPYDTLLERVEEGYSGTNRNRVRIFVRNLCRNLGDDSAVPDDITNAHGGGYSMPDLGER